MERALRFDLYPQDVRLLTEDDLAEWGDVDLVIAGWPCQGHSQAGTHLGLRDPRSALFFEMLRVCRILQQRNPGMGYVFENVPRAAFQHSDNPEGEEVSLTRHLVRTGNPVCAV